ncbi:MAG: RNA pseudouridine synthase [Deltaproteobacteria bacterium]|nr:RNA pseudouridine synthase [Deltaproteobacteria bacterium]
MGSKPEQGQQAGPPSSALRVLFDDNHMLAVFKPAGLVTQAGRRGEPCLLEQAREWVRARYEKPGRVFLGLVHRLDRPVAGVVVLARTSKGASRLSQQFRDRTPSKIYRALVSGKPRPREHALVHYVRVAPDGRGSLHDESGPGRKQARLRYRMLREGSPSLLEVELGTGRKHQIRMQLSRHGHPIVGDRRYGSRVPFTPDAIALVAWQLAVDHPTQPDRRVVLTVPDALLPATMVHADQ